MTDWVNNFIDEDPLITGLIFILIGVGYLIYKIDKGESFRMKDFSAGGWKALVNSWAIIFMLIIAGLIFIFRN